VEELRVGKLHAGLAVLHVNLFALNVAQSIKVDLDQIALPETLR
jgi:hypothetical protein